MDEFAIIDKYFNSANIDSSVLVGIGDDAAICQTNGEKLAISTDTLIAGVHFLPNTDAADIAYKALAVNLSDMAAMGAKPKWFTIAISLPKIDDIWLSSFANSLLKLADIYGVNLIGGDTTKGSLSITITIIGISGYKPLLRSTAMVGDKIFISNTLGDAALALNILMQDKIPTAVLQQALNRPKPQVELGLELVNIANSCIDISDGLLADLGHILNKSNVGAIIDIDKLPLSTAVRDYIDNTNDWCLALSGGDDYQLCWSVSANNLAKLEQLKHKFNYTEIGTISKSLGLSMIKNNQEIKTYSCKSYNHF